MKNKQILSILLGLSLVFWPQGVVLANTNNPLRHPEFISGSYVEILPVRPGNQVQNDDKVIEVGLKLALPFAVDSHWESVSNNFSGIDWQTGDQTTRFGIRDGKFIASENDTWFIYGWFGALKAIKQPYNIKYPAWGDRHNGIDFAGKEGLEVVSASAGKVIFTGLKIGNTVIIDAGNGYQITYGHLQDMQVSRGQYIKTGDLIGHLGHTGTVNPHLHFEIDQLVGKARTAINPVPLLDVDWDKVVIPDAEANQFCTDNQNPLEQSDFTW